MAGASSRDPRSIVTPDAFEVSKGLLGAPLASPFQRLAAILIDLAVVGILTVVTKNFALILGVLVTIALIRAGLKLKPVRGSVFNRAMRLSVGCLGVFVGVVTAIVWAAVGIGGGGNSAPRDPSLPPGTTDVVGAFALVRDGAQLMGADDAAEAERLIEALVLQGQGLDMPEADIRAALLEVVPGEAPWAAEVPGMMDRAFARQDSIADTLGIAVAGVPGAADSLLQAVAGDTLQELEDRIAELERLAESRRRQLTEAQEALEAAEETGLLAWLRGFADELGFGFGWASLYLTVTLSWWKGQTLGKRLVGIRVLRLDGEPITWWTAFERAGGYAAGFATGLLGFAQVYWDSNRQGIHDRIAGTVVVVDGAERVGNWQEAM